MPFLRPALLSACLALCGASALAGEIAVIVKTTNSTFWQNVNKGAEAGMKEVAGHTMTFAGPASESAIADQVNLVENAVNRKVAGIVLAPSDPDALVPAIRKAWESRIPVVLIDSQVADSGKNYYQSFLTTDNRAAGELCARELIAKVGTSGKVAVMSYVAGAGSEVGRVGAFTAYLKAHSKLQVVGPFYSQSQMATALNQTTDVLAAHKDLKAAIVHCEKVEDFVSREIFTDILESEEEHIDWLETNLGLIKLMGLQNFIQSSSEVGEKS